MDLKPYKLLNRIQHYAWGAKNQDAYIPALLGKKTEPDKPYAELWIGTHPNASSTLFADGENHLLQDWISRNPDAILGQDVSRRFGGQLPFLLKVLSAGEVLSIQAHPDKMQAEQLHKRDPEHYPDDNHKPEIAIALDALTALVGFKSSEDLVDTLNQYPEILDFIGADQAQNFISKPDENLKQLFSTMMSRSLSFPDQLQDAINRLANRLSVSSNQTEADSLFLQLRNIYKEPDIGLFTLFILNLIHLNPGEGIFLKAGIPHAYVKGNIVECMANSDNVVRAGLTPKFKDIETLTQILTYEQGVPEIYKILDKSVETHYQPPVSEFHLQRLDIEKDRSVEIQMETGIQILLMIEGAVQIQRNSDESINYKKGDSILLPARLKQYTIKSEESARIFIAEPGIS